ncbi:MAG: hypothetical protein M1818_000034 [Claussenomyces sp. TS43310]|nr:MAG: hypothetical protein M1818_000034 [Claussenomyces sp. TS43310]
MSVEDPDKNSRGRALSTSSTPQVSTSSSQDDTLPGSPPHQTPLEGTAHANQPVNESSPLLSASSSEDGEDDGLVDDQTVLDEHDEYQTTRSFGYLVLLTISMAGLQLAWATELSNGSPYLLSLGLSKSLMALVWIAGPLSGSLVQPYVGIRSDRCRVSWGKRKPFMIAGASATIFSLLALAWVREIVGGFLGLFGADPASHGVKTCIIIVAVFLVYILDFAINTVQAGIRAFMVDCAPTHQQEATNAMASRITGIGNIIAYVFGYIDLPKYLWFFGNTQFKVLCVIASLGLASTIAVSIIFIKERDPRLEGPPSHGKGGIFATFGGLFKSIKGLPPQTRKVCEVQLFAWIGWFGWLFYLSTWIGEMYVQPFVLEHPDLTPHEVDQLYEKATRVGTFAMLIYAITSLVANVLLPFIVAPTYQNLVSSGVSAASRSSQKLYTNRTERFLERLVIPWLSLRRTWMLSLLLFGLCLISTLLIRSVTAATVLAGIVGVSWAVTTWAPFAIISSEISKRDATRRAQRLSREIIDPGDDNGDQAGVILGIHNVSIAAPQVLATLGSSVIFKFLQKPRGTPGDNSVAAVFAAGGVFVLFSAFIASRLAEEKELPPSHLLGSSRPRALSRNASFGNGVEY